MLQASVLQALVYFACFFLVWIGSGLVVSTISKLAKAWKLPAFIVSFFLLGLLTSLPEITINTIAIFNHDPVIMVGNLLGGIIIMFLGVIPLLGILGNGIHMPRQLDRKELVMTLLVVIAPAFLTADQKLGSWEALFLILLYLSQLIFFSSRQSAWEKVKKNQSEKKISSWRLLLKIVLGIAMLIGASNQIVNSTIYFTKLLDISSFIISLIVVALGANIPEIAIVFRSVISKKKDIALADYLGSASANTLLLGIFTLVYGKTIILPNHFFQRFSFLAIGLILFFFFSRSKNTLSRKESVVLMTLYVAFVLFEFLVIAKID